MFDVADSTQDSGVSVRKRVVKLLTGIFPTVADSMIRADICCRLIEAMNDQDENIKVGFERERVTYH